MIDGLGSATHNALEAIKSYESSLAATTENISKGSSDLAKDAVQVKIDSAGIEYSTSVLKSINEASEAVLDLFA